MDWTVCSRETERDYTWDNTQASHPVAQYAQGRFAPGFEGSLTTSRFAALLRCPGSPRGVMLSASVSTERNDFRYRPIRTMVVLRAENPDEEKLLASFFAEILRKKDEETLRAPESGIAKAVESLYQTKKTDEFLAFCKSVKPVDGKGDAPKNRWAIPRNDEGERKSLADALPAAITGDSPFLFALTDRLPTDVLASLGSMFDRGTVWIFSEATTSKEPIPGGSPNTRAVAAAIGGIILLALLVAVRGCSNDGGPSRGETVREKSTIDNSVDGGGNAPSSIEPERSPVCRPDPENDAPQVEPSPSPLTITVDSADEAAETADEAAKAADEVAEATDKADEATDKADEATDKADEATDKADEAADDAAENADEVAETKGEATAKASEEAAEAADEAAEAADEAAETADEVAETKDEVAKTADEAAEAADEAAETTEEATQAERKDNEPESLSQIPQQAP